MITHLPTSPAALRNRNRVAAAQGGPVWKTACAEVLERAKLNMGRVYMGHQLARIPNGTLSNASILAEVIKYSLQHRSKGRF